MREIRVSCVQPLGQQRMWPFGGETDRAVGRELVERNLEMATRLLTQAGQEGCDVVCYPEDIQGIAAYGYWLEDTSLFTDFVESVPGPTTERVSEVAQRYRMHVVFGCYERVGDRIYNAAVLLNREGEIIGKYHKVQLPGVERWGVEPGDGFPVFETEFGTVGMLVCYDLMFPEPARALALNGAEILFNPTMDYSTEFQCPGNGLIRAQARALDNFLPVVVSLCGHESVIIDGRGHVRAQAEGGREQVLSARLDLDDTPMDHSQWEVLTGTACVKSRYFQERHPEAYGVLVDLEPPVMARCREEANRLKEAPEERRAAFEEIRRRWGPKA